MKLQFVIIGILFSIQVFADGFSPDLTSQDQPWSVTASVGGGKYCHVYPKDSQSILGRLALGNEMFLTGDIALGLELGLQNGNHMHLEISDEALAVLKWLPVQTNLGPMLDLLITAKSDPLLGSSFFAQLKGGFAYRDWKIQQLHLYEFSRLAGEIQAGFGYPISTLATLSLLYQGVFGSDPNYRIDFVTRTNQVSNIPALHGILLGLSFNL